MEVSSVFKIENLSVDIRRKTILDNISFEIDEGEIVGFLGPNGSGKTTTIKACASLIPIKSGIVQCDDFDMKENYIKYMSQMGFMFDKSEFYSNLTGYQNLKLFTNIYPKEECRDIQECISLVNLQNRIHDRVSTYSFGMKQRLNFAKAILLKSVKLIIMDEPLNGIDPEGVIEFRSLVMKLREQTKCAFLISSHLLSELETICDSFVFIKHGKIVDKILIKDQVINYYIYTREIDKAVNILRKLGIHAEKLNAESVKVYSKDRELSEILEILLKNDIKFSKTTMRSQIEDLYLNKVGGNIIE